MKQTLQGIKQKLDKVSNVLNTHWRLITLIALPLLTLFFTLVEPVFLVWVCLPFWVWLLVALVPCVIMRFIQLYHTRGQRLFKSGDAVSVKHTDGLLYVGRYAFFTHKKVLCLTPEGERIIFYQAMLTTYEPRPPYQMPNAPNAGNNWF